MGDEFESNNFENIEAGSNESLLDMLHGIASKHPYSPALKSSKSHLTSEVDVSFKDLEPPLSGRSYTAACKTSPTQISDDRCSRLSTVSTSSYFAKNPDMTMFYSPQIPIEHKPEKVVEEINKQFEPMKMKMLSESVKLQPQPVQQIQKVTFAKPLINSFSTSVPASPSQSYRNIAAENSATFASTVERQSERVVEEQPVKALNVSIDGQPKPVQQVQKVTFAKNLVHVSSPSREAISSHTVRQQQPAPPANASVQRQPLRALSLGDQSSVPLVYAPTRHPLPKPAPQIGKRSKMLEFWRQKETENGGLPISYSNSEI
uniref:Uncharacterized protein n=1 Tax=Panagrolaimus superbus TaxID=310955 RepID=A0A914Z2J2_9BILA